MGYRRVVRKRCVFSALGSNTADTAFTFETGIGSFKTSKLRNCHLPPEVTLANTSAFRKPDISPSGATDFYRVLAKVLYQEPVLIQ